MENSIVWTGSPDDQTARINDNVLRVEKLDTDLWWWCMYFGEEYYEMHNRRTRKLAKQAAEAAYREHKTKQQ